MKQRARRGRWRERERGEESTESRGASRYERVVASGAQRATEDRKSICEAEVGSGSRQVVVSWWRSGKEGGRAFETAK